MKTDDQKKADFLVEEAIQFAAAAYNLIEDGILVEYVCVVEGQTYLDEDPEDSMEHWGLIFRHGVVRSVTGIGLLTKGLDLLQHGERQ